MSTSFSAVVSPSIQVLAKIGGCTPESAFNTPAYAGALPARKAEPCALMLNSDQGEVICGCLAALSGNRWNRKLEIFTCPTLASPSVFWRGVAEFCRHQNVCILDVQTFASESPDMPSFGNPLSTRRRYEYSLDITDSKIFSSFSENHKRSIKKAGDAELGVVLGKTFDNYQTHIRLMDSSVTRRRDRGEQVIRPRTSDFDFALIEGGAAKLFQARMGDQVLASVLILMSKESGYYHSAGTSQDGMKIGASAFLISEVAKTLASSGRKLFNLGGVDPDATGLRRFKKGFGAQENQLTAEVYSMISPLERKLRDIAGYIWRTTGNIFHRAHVGKSQSC